MKCQFCGIEKEKYITLHERMCPKNPHRIVKPKGIPHKKKDSNDKTEAAKMTNFATSPGINPSIKTPNQNSPVASESHSKILKEINMNKEFDKMAEKFKGGGSDAEKEKKYKYKCECGAYFNIPGEGNVCPDCGK